MAAKININSVGSVEIDKKFLKCDFKIGFKEFQKEFGSLMQDNLPTAEIKKAIKSPNKEIKLEKGQKGLLDKFFKKVQTQAQQSMANYTQGFSSDEKSESMMAEDMKSYGATSNEIKYNDSNRTATGIATYDSKTGAQEGEIILGDKGATGELVPIEIAEKLEAHFEFNADSDIEEERATSGIFTLENPSSENKIWDIDVSLKKDKEISLEDNIHLNNLEPNGKVEYDYEISEFEEPALRVHEFISTLNDEEVETFSLSTAESNVVLFKITATNVMDYDLYNVKITKEIEQGYSDVSVMEATNGNAAQNADNNVEWVIEKLAAGEEASTKINMTIDVSSSEEKRRTGKIYAEYHADKAITGVEIDKFDAYSDNRVLMLEEQEDDDPDKYDCSVWFKNESDFQMQLVNLDVIDAETGNKVLDIDPQEIPVIAAGATWKSVNWETKTEDGLEPQFHKKVEFFLVANRQVSTIGELTFDDIELAVTAMMGTLNYSTEAIASYRIVPFDVLHQVKNTGGADLNELVMKEVIQSGYVPPKADEIELYILRPEDGDDPTLPLDSNETPDWENLGEQISIDESMIEISPNDQEPDNEHVLRINLKELKDNAIGMFLPGMVIKAKYPIKAYKAAKDSEFVSNVEYLGNTYPAGAETIFTPEEIRIPVIHSRKKLLKGKSIRALPVDGQYEITISVTNTGIFPIENVERKDIVPENFEYGDYSLEPVKFENLEGKDLLIWNIDKIEADETYEITYIITGTGDNYKASDAQFSV